NHAVLRSDKDANVRVQNPGPHILRCFVAEPFFQEYWIVSMIWYAKFDNSPPQDTARFFCIFHSGFTNLHHAMMRTRCCFRKPKQEIWRNRAAPVSVIDVAYWHQAAPIDVRSHVGN